MAMDRESEMGGLWVKTSQAGREFMSGTLTIDGQPVEVVLFPNTYKKPGERTPDWRVYKSQPREGAPAPRQEYQTPAPGQRQLDAAYMAQAPEHVATTPPQTRRSIRADDELDDDIPF
jgi:uncharacterized protein (DUF736 family)